MENKFVSIIIPVYDCKNYMLNRCLKSILNQKYKNIEILIIENGPQKLSEKIIREFNDNRIIYYYIPKADVSNARNYGLKKIKGEYVFFVDIDDTITNNAIEELVNTIENKNCDAILFNYNKLINNSIQKNNFEYEEGIVYNDKIMNVVIPDLISTNLWGSIWRVFYKVSLIKDNKIKFKQDIKVAEDLLFNIEIFSKINSIYLLNKEFYNYHINAESTLNRYKKNNIKNNMLFQKELQNLVKKIGCNKKYSKCITYNKVVMYTTSISNAVRNKKINNILKEIKKIEEIFKEDKCNYKNLKIKRYKKFTLFLLKIRATYILGIIYYIKEKIRLLKTKRKGVRYEKNRDNNFS